MLPAYPNYLARSFLPVDFSRKEDRCYFDSVDVIHSTDQLIPIVRNKPLLATVMDTIPISHPQFLRAQSRIFKPYLWKKLAQRANHIITISEFSKSEIVNLMGFPEERVTTIPLGVNQKYFEKISGEGIQLTLDKFNINKPFFLFIGSIQPRKNLKRIIAAHQCLPKNFATEFPLVIVGKDSWGDISTNAVIQNAILEKRCIRLNYISEFEKRCLLQSTLGLVFASLYEGFGLPILEAFASKCPVITSNCTAMPEVSADAALLVNPSNVDSIRNALISLIQDQNLAEQLKKCGMSKVVEFSWEKTAQNTIKIYQMLLENYKK
jgi:alpha-1,3-rhamnosyl/mannosyltransferase